jgi:hypothetical protein
MTLQSRTKALVACSFLGWVAACTGSKQDQAKKLEQERASCGSTEQLTHELSGLGDLPKTYTRKMLQKTEKKLDQIKQQEGRLSQ